MINQFAQDRLVGDVMARSSKKNQPSLVYVFVALSVAAFLVLFTIFREPGISYETAATFQTHSAQESLADQLLKPEFVLQSLRNAEMISGSASDELLRISEEISQRMTIKVAAQHDVSEGQLTLVTSHPKAAIRLLDSMMQQASAADASEVISFAVQPAAIARTRGGSVTPGTLLLLAACSGVCGFCGVYLAKRARASSLLYTSQEVKEVAGVPVIADLFDGELFFSQERQLSRRRLSRLTVRAAELTIATVFLVMAYQLTTHPGFSLRFLQDPFAAYGEALTQLIG